MKKNILNFAILCLLCCGFMQFLPSKIHFTSANNDEITINSTASYLIEISSNTEILANNADKKLPIASMTKLATLAIIFDEIDCGRLDPEDYISISQTAAAVEGSSAFLDAGSKYKVKDLIKTIVMVSANDSCVALAEKISGTEELFAKRMNNLAADLKLANTHFENCTGLPSPSHFSSARDIAKIYTLVCDNKLYKEYSKIWMEDFIHPSGRKTGLVNTNRLIKTYAGCTGGKTGHTNEAKYCLTASAERSGLKFIAVVIGAETSKIRFAETTKMFNYGFANYLVKNLVSSNLPLARIEVRGAQDKICEVYANSEFSVLEKKGEEKHYSTKLLLPDTLKAPISQEDSIGKILVLNENNIVVKEIDLHTHQSIEKIKFGDAFKTIINKW